MSGSINWMGNRVLDPSTSRQSVSPITSTTQTQGSTTQTTPNSQSSLMVPAPAQQGSFVPETRQGPPPSTEKGYIPYYLTTHIGRNVRAEFIVGTNQYMDKVGVLTEVGINYFVLRDVNSNTDVMCDLYSVKFVTSIVP